MRKYIIAAFLAFGIFIACVVSAHAVSAESVVSIVKDMFGVCLETVNSGEEDWVAARNQINSHWQSYSSVSSMGRLYLSYDVMSNLVAELNGQGFPCRLEWNRNLQLYIIYGLGEVGSVTGVSVNGLYLTNGSRDLFCCEFNTDSLLSSISSKLSTVTDRLSTLISNVSTIHSDLESIDLLLSACAQSLSNLNNYFNGEFQAYFFDIMNYVASSDTFLGQISTKMDSVVNTLTTENGKNSLFYPITQRLDTIISRIVPAYSHPFANRGWCLSGNDLSSLSVSDVGYSALSSMMETVTEEYLSYNFFAGSYHIDVLDSLSIVHATVGGNTGYFIRGTGTLSKSVNGINEFYENQTFYLGESDSTLFYASDASRASAGASVSLSSDALYTNFGTIGQLAQAYQDGTLDPSTTFPTLNAVVVGLLGLAQKIDAVDLNPKVEVVVKEAEYTVNHFTDVVVDSSSDIYNVFYLTDEDGNQTSVGRVAADSLGAAGKLLQFLFKFCVDGALSGVDGSMDSLNDFFFDNAESSLGEGVSIWD